MDNRFRGHPGLVVVEIHVPPGPIPKGKLRRVAVIQRVFIIFARGWEREKIAVSSSAGENRSVASSSQSKRILTSVVTEKPTRRSVTNDSFILRSTSTWHATRS